MSFLNGVITAIVSTAKLVGSKASFTTIIMQVIMTLPDLVMKAIDFGKLDTVQKLDEALGAADLRLGEDVGAIDIMHDLPPDKEELLTDHLLGIIKILAYSKLKVDGYYQ